ncbi:uncharacterized protein LOC120349807 [Nilaparvata lugens]|uniref:uncharacterized protein LOC120349807 n=1 Tax=Nilaparvata lugens TaxID=108931 RepID=UPI00193CAE25|nr:uncharacterized protein LOC120349807 [Nilaparvata lugens]
MHLRFIDTFRFTPDSLDNLVTNLVKSASNPEYLSKVLPHTAKVFGNKLSLVSRKGVFPYDYCNSWQRLKETLLPPKEAFFSKLVDRSVSNDDYEHAQTVWNQFSCRTLGEYSDLYLKTDVLLLADVFESFHDVCMKTYDLDCAHYFTSPGFSFDVMLKYTKVELELLTDYDMYMFIERGIRGGMTNCIHRHAVANNAYTGAPIDPEKPTSYLLYTEANNLYGWEDFLAPYIMLNTRLRQQSKNKFEKNFFKLMNNAVFGKTMENVRKRMSMELVNDENRLKKLIARPVYKDRIIFVLDISKTLMYQFHYDVMKPTYKENLQLLYQDTDSLFYIVKTENLYNDIINNQQLKDTFDTSENPADHPCYSDANKMVLENKKTLESNHIRLMTALSNHEHYVCHYHTLKQAVQHGLKIIKVQQGVQFEQEDFLAPYIMLNTRLRQQSKNKFEKNFFKLMNNAVFGKMMENVRKRVSMELVNDENRLKKLIARPVYKDHIIFGENICAVTMHKEKVELNKPIYIGLSVLDISKTLMYEFH